MSTHIFFLSFIFALSLGNERLELQPLQGNVSEIKLRSNNMMKQAYSYELIGNGWCTNGNTRVGLVHNWITTAVRTSSDNGADECERLCNCNPFCIGYATEDGTKCQIMPGKWWGSAFTKITGHDSQTRNYCFRKTDTWTTVAVELKGSGNGVQFENDPLRTLNFPNLPSYVQNGKYLVRLEWPCDFVEFTVPAGQNIFNQVSGDTVVTGVSTSVTSPAFGTTARFCHACVANSNYKPGDTCWALTPIDDFNRVCGCNNHNWHGSGIYYGGYKSSSVCTAHGGGFAGAILNSFQKGNLSSVGLTIRIKQ